MLHKTNVDKVIWHGEEAPDWKVDWKSGDVRTWVVGTGIVLPVLAGKLQL